MSSQNHGQPIPSPEQGEAPPSGVAMPTPSEDNPSPQPVAEPSAQDTSQAEGDEGLEPPLPSSPGAAAEESVEEPVEERVLKLEQRQERTVEDVDQPLPPARGMSLEERVSRLERWQGTMDQQFEQQQQQLEERNNQIEEKDDQIRRHVAEFDNFRRRSERDQDKLKLRYTCAVLREILPIVDNFERARKALSPEKLDTLHALDVHQDYQGIYKQLVTALKRLNVSSMNAEGQVFDPSLHEAVMRERSHEYEEDVVMEELQRGYHLEGEVLRHAMVKVSMGPGPDDEPYAVASDDGP